MDLRDLLRDQVPLAAGYWANLNIWTQTRRAIGTFEA